MRGWQTLCRRPSVSRLVLALSLAGLAAGCSSGNVRLAGTPLFASSSSTEPSALAPIESSDLPPATGAAYQQISTPAGLKARGYTVENAPIVEVGPGDTAMTLSQGFGVPADVILDANSLQSSSQIRPGQRLVIPVRVSLGASAEPIAPTALAAVETPVTAIPATDITLGAPSRTLGEQAAERRHLVQSGETLWSISSSYGVSTQQVAALNGLTNGTVKIGETLRIPAAGGVSSPAPTEVVSIDQKVVTDALPEGAGPTLAPPSAAEAKPVSPGPSTATPTSESVPQPAGFRWPVQGRIIAGFGKQADGKRNDGINLAVPSGTPVHAAASGTVIYAGNELEGYGNLILVQHEDDWVSAYAHNETLNVSRGDKVSRGQLIAKVGNSGSVQQPQLHFELRKKSKPVDPLPHLSGA